MLPSPSSMLKLPSICSRLLKIPSQTYPVSRVSGIPYKLSSSRNHLPSKRGEEYQKRMNYNGSGSINKKAKYRHSSLSTIVTSRLGWAKPCSCSYWCSRHLRFYDSGRLGRVEIVTLGVSARAKEGSPVPAPFGSPHFLLSSGSFNMALSLTKTFARRKKTPSLQATSRQVQNTA